MAIASDAGEIGPSGALLRLLRHDLRAPLGPLMLAVSSLAGDESLPADVRQLAELAVGETARLGQVMEAAVTAASGATRLTRSRIDVLPLAADALDVAAADGASAEADADPIAMRRAFTWLRTALGGDALAGGSLAAAPVAGWAELRLRTAGAGVVAEALSSHGPASEAAALVLGAARLVSAHSGVLVADDGIVIVRLPRSAP